MLKRFFNSDKQTPAKAENHSVAVSSAFLSHAALLVHAARQDGNFDDKERAIIEAYLKNDCGLDAEPAQRLLAAAEEEEEKRADLFVWTRQINNAHKETEKAALLEALWRVVLADGVKDMFESTLLRRLAGLFHISDHEAAKIRQQATQTGPSSSGTAAP